MKLHWDKEDGEEWGIVTNEKEIFFYFSAHLPFVFVSNDLVAEFTILMKQNNLLDVVIVEIKNFDAPIYSLDIAVLDQVLKWHSSLPSKNIPIKDLWFATV